MDAYQPDDTATQDDGYHCQNCSRVLVETQGDICASCRAMMNPTPEPDPREALGKALQVVIDPTSIVTEAAANREGSKLPWAVAVLGLCVVGMIWANSLEGKR
jgi:hypothetical protein